MVSDFSLIIACFYGVILVLLLLVPPWLQSHLPTIYQIKASVLSLCWTLLLNYAAGDT